jgi:hypothetical protein
MTNGKPDSGPTAPWRLKPPHAKRCSWNMSESGNESAENGKKLDFGLAGIASIR